MHSPCDLRSPDSLRFVCDPRGGEGGRVSNLHTRSPLPQPTASRTLGSPCLSPGPSLLAGAGLGRAGSLRAQEGEPILKWLVQVVGKILKNLEDEREKGGGVGRGTQVRIEGHGHTYTHPPSSFAQTSLVRPAPFKTAPLFPALFLLRAHLLSGSPCRTSALPGLGFYTFCSLHPGSKIAPGAW